MKAATKFQRSYDSSGTVEGVTSPSPTESFLDHLSYSSFEVEATDEDKRLVFPITVMKGEKVRITVEKIKDVDVMTNSQNEQFAHIMNGDTEDGEEVSVVNRVQILKIMRMILNVTIATFFSASLIFLLCAVFNIFLPRSDSLFGFFLCFLTGFLFVSDKMYRRLKNAGF
ncbi:hypothetical protein ACQKLN_31330 [Paenibacillus glucanolyticus]|uniref:hypothetical protein n=1 Tax=Paenibacillus glucanolyticus TaxID=59843 RepID=UPI003D07FDF8